jgi:pimeloyl-ACP methyl ester carboxylesterase
MVAECRFEGGRELRTPRWIAACQAAVMSLLMAMAPAARAQDKTADKNADKPLPPQVVAIKTTDGVALAATYYPSKAGKDSAAVILIHDDAGQRSDLDRLARSLQLGGSAVIVPDLRGHGDSDGELKDLRPEDYVAMVRRDLEAVKGFLMERNNAGELNIERLGVVGIGMGTTLALNWAALDWAWPVLATGKQGQDVKAVVLVSPEWAYKGLRIGEAVVEPGVRSEMSLLIVAGRRNGKMLSEARRLYNSFARYHNVSPSVPLEQQTLFFKTPSTSLQGMALVNEKGLDVEPMIVEFVDLRLVKPAATWQVRKGPL